MAQTKGIDAQLRTADGWTVPDAVLTVTTLAGEQVARVPADADGAVCSEQLPADTYTAIVTAPGFDPVAKLAIVPPTGTLALGVVTMTRAAGSEVPPPGTWAIDPAHSTIGLTARHLGIAVVRGRLTEFTGQVVVADQVERSGVSTQMQVRSLDTGNATRDEHLKSADFLDIENFPLMEYRGAGLTALGDGRWSLDGELTLHGVSKSVPLQVDYLGQVEDPWGNDRLAFRGVTELRRKDFEISMDTRLLSGVAQIGNAVRIEIDIQAVRQES
ncbi:hypothetical protein G4X40_16210 [Rhodococcus sp. D2-41]|uniref:YceI family protein n=1 Tax=Speluncibacter jeojiensis TaxID=2710754 RepID=A0A9X4M1B2_9ACTN|nr:YceI family protein [Rhodococcus sp. D2-41]MDG3011689.1 hypothetical protein [Rhodococcus sp. D2-41]MDG3014957.1 YceI family protein [Corynebacteriales bacterium D3-21]